MASGRASRVTDPAQKVRGLKAIMAHMAPGAPAEFKPEAVARVDVWRVDVEHLTGKRQGTINQRGRILHGSGPAD